jgi:uncharacterized membrane protein YccC
MMAADAEAAFFSLRTFAAAMLAFYAAASIGLAQPVWAVTTVYLISQPLSGAVLSKALFRFIGTILGAAAAVAFLPAFVNEPFALSLVLALWLGLCVYFALLDRTPRSYAFVLAGYTVAIIGFPSVQAPAGIFNSAILRVQETGLAIGMVCLVHGIWPQTVTMRLRSQVAAVVASAEQLGRSALSGARDAGLDQQRRRLARSVNDIEQLSFHLAFDTARILPLPAAVRALQDQISWLAPLNAVVEDRLAEVRAAEGVTPGDVAEAVRRIESWLGSDLTSQQSGPVASDLVCAARRLEPAHDASAPWGWTEMLRASLSARLEDFVLAHQMLRELRDHVLDGHVRQLSPQTVALVRSAAGRSFHRDHGLAIRSALGAVVAVCVVCVFWIETAWPHGSFAALIVGIASALFATAPSPSFAVRRFFLGTLLGVIAAAPIGFVILPRVTDFALLAGVLAPPLLLVGSLQARPLLAPLGTGGAVGLTNNLIALSYQSDFSGYLNGAIAEIAALGGAVIIVELFQVVGADFAIARLSGAARREIAARADGRARNTRLWTSRMIDRISLIAARSRPEKGPESYDGLVGMRIGYLAGELQALASNLSGEQHRCVRRALSHVSAHFRGTRPAPATPLALEAIDEALTTFAHEPSPERRGRGVILLTGLRRALFPQATPYVLEQP